MVSGCEQRPYDLADQLQQADLLGVDDGGRIGMLQCSDLVLEVPDDVLTHINKTPGGRN